MSWRQWLQGWRGAAVFSALILGVTFIDSIIERPEYLFPPYFKHDFTPKEDYRSLPVLSYEDEKKYEVKDLQD